MKQSYICPGLWPQWTHCPASEGLVLLWFPVRSWDLVFFINVSLSNWAAVQIKQEKGERSSHKYYLSITKKATTSRS